MENDIKRLEIIIDTFYDELNNDDENVYATLDIHDIKALKRILKDYKKIKKIDKDISDDNKCFDEILLKEIKEIAKSITRQEFRETLKEYEILRKERK